MLQQGFSFLSGYPRPMYSFFFFVSPKKLLFQGSIPLTLFSSKLTVYICYSLFLSVRPERKR